MNSFIDLPLRNGFRLAVWNTVLSVLCVSIFSGILGLILLISWIMRSMTGNPALAFPFPFPWLLLLFAGLMVTAWITFGRCLEVRSTRQAFLTGLVGATPLYGLSGLGYLWVIWMSLFGDFGANQMLGASIFVYGLISTLILLAGLTCTVVVVTSAKHR